MNVLSDNIGTILRGFRETIALTVISAVIAIVLGVVLAAMRVSPAPPLRWAGTSYVNLFRNTPLLLLFVLFVFGLPTVGIHASFFIRAVVALSLYTAAFVCEAVRSGINTVQAGQAEAARAVGMTFGQTLRHVVLPQAMRAAIPPVGSILIALTRNTSVAEAFGTKEATYVLDSLGRDHASQLYWIFGGIALGYIILSLAIAGGFRLLERHLAVAR
ncbi:MAG TPA: amino acid ABC transporter permease [Mycobacteriales bacterium]|nr:amino acid ABC transporter permease [Mycobacteriales bacterium]